MITVINYGVGNLFSLVSSLEFIGEKVRISGDPAEILRAEKLILPGVGAFEDAAKKLRDTHIGEIVKEKAAAGTPMLGICLGMQLFFEKSFEYGEHEGLGLLRGEVIPIKEAAADSDNLKIPQIGWNRLRFKNGRHELFRYVEEGEHVYFVHSYCAVRCEDSLIAVTDVSENSEVTAAAAKGNILACQFHPEKSGRVGLNILRAFAEM
ncbi:MAG: imidazole glycerol phosphate synthase subunit HisH [Eubacteriales bacterium]